MHKANEIFSKNFKREFDNAGYGVSEYARLRGCDRTTLYTYFNGRSLPPLDKIYDMAEDFGCTVEDLVL